MSSSGGLAEGRESALRRHPAHSGWSDPVRVGRLFDAVGPGLLHYLRTRTDFASAEDLVSETFIIVGEQLARFDAARGSERSWIYGIATNLLRHHLRAQTRPRRSTLYPVGNTDSVDDDVADRVDAQRRVCQLANALADLSDGDRDVLLLTAWADLESAEVAAVLGIPPGTVRSRLNRVRRHLKQTAASLNLTDSQGDES